MASLTNEFTNSLTSISNNYSVPPQYNTLIAKKLPPTTPSQSFPTILVQNQHQYGYNSLTHDSDQVGYYNLVTAYGNNCEPNYVVAKCPENKVLREFNPKETTVSPSASPQSTMYISEGYNPPKHKILFFTKDNCVHCTNALNEYKQALGNKFNDHFVVKNINNKDNLQELNNLGGTGTPFFVSTQNYNKVLGHKPLKDLLSNLNYVPSGNVNVTTPTNPSANTLADLKLLIFTTNGCQHCDNLKKMLGNNNQFVEYAKPTHSLHKVVKGYPFILSQKTQKTFLGAPKSLPDLINQLK